MACPPWYLKIRVHVAQVEEWVLCCLLTLMIVLACTQIFLRIIFSGGLIWADPLLRYLVLWVGLLGAAAATRQGKHIAIDIASHLVSEKIYSYLVLLIVLFSATVSIGLTYAAVLFIKSEIIYGGDSTILGIPSWALNIIFPIAFGLIAVRYFIMTFESIQKILKREPCQPPTIMARKPSP